MVYPLTHSRAMATSNSALQPDCWSDSYVLARRRWGLIPLRSTNGDYKTFDGVEVATHVVFTRPNRTLDIHFFQVTQNVPIDNAKFARP